MRFLHFKTRLSNGTAEYEVYVTDENDREVSVGVPTDDNGNAGLCISVRELTNLIERKP